MINYTSSLPDNTLEKLNEMSKQMKVPKNEIINKALIVYFEAIERQMYIQSFKKIAGDTELIDLAEEDMGDYLKQIEAYEKK